MNRIPGLFVLLMLAPASAIADPGPAIRYLIDEPASLLDVGFIRLNQSLEDNADIIRLALDEQDEVSKFSTIQIAAEYYFASDEITVLVAGFTTENPSTAGCRDVLKVLRATVPKLLNDSFRHYGYESEEEPEELIAELENQTRLVCSIHRPLSPKALVEVSGKLTDAANIVSKDADK